MSQTCEDLGAVLFVHPWDMIMGGRYSKYWLPWLVGMPAETARAACCLAMGGVRERHSQNCRSELEALGWWTRGADGNPCLLGDFAQA